MYAFCLTDGTSWKDQLKEGDEFEHVLIKGMNGLCRGPRKKVQGFQSKLNEALQLYSCVLAKLVASCGSSLSLS